MYWNLCATTECTLVIADVLCCLATTEMDAMKGCSSLLAAVLFLCIYHLVFV